MMKTPRVGALPWVCISMWTTPLPAQDGSRILFENVTLIDGTGRDQHHSSTGVVDPPRYRHRSVVEPLGALRR